MKVVAICERSNIDGKLPYYYVAGEKVRLEEGSEYQVVKVEIGAWSSDVWIKLPDQSVVHVYGIFNFELILERTRHFRERRVPFDIIDDLFDERGLDSPKNYHRWFYSDDMPSVTTDYVVIFD